MVADNDNFRISRSDARRAGLTHYFTGEPCKHGHIAVRYVGNAACIECSRDRGQKWRAENPDKARESRVKWVKANPEKDREVKRVYAEKAYAADPIAANMKAREWRSNNREQLNARRREKRAADPEAAREEARRWRAENRESVLQTQRKSYRKRRKVAAARLNASMSAGIRHSIRNGTKKRMKWEWLVGYSVTDLIAHLERLFHPKMSWENYGEWEIDHIIPLSAHNFQAPGDIDFKKAWALKNLQPLWASDNRRKNNRLTKPFQPSLLLAANDNEPEK